MLRQLLRYDPETGAFHWRERDPSLFAPTKRMTAEQRARGWNTRQAGKVALNSSDGKGYVGGSVLGRKVKAYRVAFAIHHGRWPVADVDHINRNRSDNRACNLREASRSQNAYNQAARGGSSSYKGVVWHRRGRKWMAQIGEKYLGLYSCEIEAAKAYDNAASKHGGVYARLNFPVGGP